MGDAICRDMARWEAGFNRLAEVYSGLPVECNYHLEPPATETELDRLEMEVGWLPRSLRRFFLTVSRSLYFRVRILDQFVDFPEELWSEYGICLSLDQVRHGEAARNNWCRDHRCRRALDVGQAPLDEQMRQCARLWQESIGFLNLPDGELPPQEAGKPGRETVWDGDVLAFDLSDKNPDPRVVYLSRDGAYGHGQVLGHNFSDFIGRLLELGGYGGVLGGWAVCDGLDRPPSVYSAEALSLRRALGLMPSEEAMH